MMSSGETFVSAKSGEVLSRLTSSIVRVASTSVHTETCGAEYADCTIADEVALRTPRTAIVSSRPAASGAGVDGATSAGPGVGRSVDAGAATAMVSFAHVAPLGRLDVAEHAGLRRVPHDILAGHLAGGAARRHGRQLHTEIARELADRRLGDDPDGCRDPLRRGNGGLAPPRLHLPAGAVPDEHRSLALGGLGGLAVLGLPDGGRGCGIRRRGDGDDRRTDVHRVTLGGEELAHGAARTARAARPAISRSRSRRARR